MAHWHRLACGPSAEAMKAIGATGANKEVLDQVSAARYLCWLMVIWDFNDYTTQYIGVSDWLRVIILDHNDYTTQYIGDNDGF